MFMTMLIIAILSMLNRIVRIINITHRIKDKVFTSKGTFYLQYLPNLIMLLLLTDTENIATLVLNKRSS